MATSQKFFLYFAYGPNMLTARLRRWIPSATPYQRGILDHYQLVFNKASIAGSTKANLVDNDKFQVLGMLFRVSERDRDRLKRAETGYDPILVNVKGEDENIYKAVVYVSKTYGQIKPPFSWYKQLMLEGASEHGLPSSYLKHLHSVTAKFDLNANRTLSNLLPLTTLTPNVDDLIEGAPAIRVTYKSDVTVDGEVATFFGTNPDPVGGKNVEIPFDANPGFTFWVSFVIKAVSTSDYTITYSLKDSNGTNHGDPHNQSPITGSVVSDNEAVVQIKLSL